MTMNRTALVFASILAVAGCSDHHMATPSPDMMSIPKDQARAACDFQAGALAKDTIDLSAMHCTIPIQHVIVLLKENRSFDHILGQLSAQGQPAAEALPSTFSNLDATGATVNDTHGTTTCVHYDPWHQWDDMHAMVDGGKMDGFVKNAAAHNDPMSTSLPPTDGHFVMTYYDQTDLPFYYWLASNFALADRYFPSVRSGTWSNRDFLVAGTSNGIKNTGSSLGEALPSSIPIIFDKLQDAQVSWQVYTDDVFPLEFSVQWGSRKKWGTTADFYAALAAGTLPAVSFIDANTALTMPFTDEHPTADVQAGEAWTRTLVDNLVKSPIWSSSVLFYTYDEAGGFADHVPPPSSCAPSADQAMFTELGVRVPFVAISPYAKRKFVSHEVHQHTSILRFIELLFNVPALTARDANSDALLDLFDFCGTPNTVVGTMPAAGTGGCK
jgi:phospholipase C